MTNFFVSANKTAKTTPCTVQIIEEFGAARDERLSQRRLTRRAKQAHDVIIADRDLARTPNAAGCA
jgi:hypothetical protein